MRELKQQTHTHHEDEDGRTPPGVRELKRFDGTESTDQFSRTPPGVRELKHLNQNERISISSVAPLPGCVN